MYATLGHRPAPAFLQELGDAATGTVQRVKNLPLRALHCEHLSSPPALSALIDKRCRPSFLAGQVQAFEPQGLGLLVWALASLGHRHDPLLQSIDAYCGGRGRCVWASAFP